MKVLIVRSNADKVNINSYNLQEIGLARALIRKGHKCDIVYYTDAKVIEKDYIYECGEKITIYWYPAIKVFNNSVYNKLLTNKRFLSEYDVIQTSEYNQIMIYLLNKLTNKPIVLYHGPYKDLRIKSLNKIYDFLFLKSITKNTDGVISKSILAEEYLKSKGFKNIETIGVGLDTERFEQDTENDNIYQELNIKQNTKLLLYIGRLEERRNIKFILDILKGILIKSKNTDIKLLMIGDGKKEDKDAYFSYAKEIDVLDNIIYIPRMDQSKLSDIYRISDVFLLPTKYEIFGMVLLESMYFGLPVVTSVNGGSLTMIKHNENGLVIDNFDKELWVENIFKILNDNKFKQTLSKNAQTTIKEKFTWDALIDRYIQVYENSLKNKNT